MTPKEASKILRQYVEDITQLGFVIFEHQNGPRPNVPYATIRYSVKPVGNDMTVTTYDPETDQLVEEVRGMSNVTYVVQAWGGDPETTLQRLRNSLYTSKYYEKLQPFGFGLGLIGEVLDTSGTLISANFEDRAQLSITFMVALNGEFASDYFNKVELTTSSKNLDIVVDVPEQ